MARTVLTAVLIGILSVLVGCQPVNSGGSQVMPPGIAAYPVSPEVIDLTKAMEPDLVEEVAIKRELYRQSLRTLVEYYRKTGNNTKLQWARKELAGLNSMPKYNYIIEATVAGPDLRVAASIPEADYMYQNAVQIEKKAGTILKDDNMLRLALAGYNQVIRMYPSSDKIDDAAYRAGGICEHFKDYSIALLYYQRTYQWDRDTVYPARFREGFIYDKHLHDRAKALAAYQRAMESIRMEGEHYQWEEFAKKRIAELTKTVEE
ncbi:MAG: tetratricopeptide repeat protein [Planctomycetota bacterium]|jgi:tetratricopeptide (TPR) repeat protein